MPSGTTIRHTNFYRRYFRPVVAASRAVAERRVWTGHGTRVVPACLGGPGRPPGGQQGLRFHDLRHTCAALLVGAGAHPKSIQEQLGHESITITFARYGHLLPGLAEALDSARTARLTRAAGSVVAIRRGRM